jgi:primosomal protein N' (replication factor Y)
VILDVACPIPLNKTFDYQPPVNETFADVSELIGRRVKVPFGAKEIVGLVTAVKETSDAPVGKLKAVSEVLDAEPLLTDQMRALAAWLSRRYVCSIGEALFALLPPGKDNPHSFKDPGSSFSPEHDAGPLSADVPNLTSDQKKAAAILHDAIYSRQGRAFLLHGAAATGKTEVYMAGIGDVLHQRKNALYLVPEIGLAIQTVKTLKARFGDSNVTVWHSDLTPKERRETWLRIKRGETPIVVGPRSAVLLPLAHLGLIIVDEEHDSSYKEERKPRFHARDVAGQRAEMEGAVVVYGSATPSFEIYQASLDNKIQRIAITERAIPASAPKLRLINLKTEKKWGALSNPLLDEIAARLTKHEQVILYLNRRGFHRFTRCPSCSWVAQCPKCGITAIHHKADRKKPAGLWCHYCSWRGEMPAACPSCNHKELFLGGYGTQRVEEEIHDRFPWARVVRWDRDAASKRGEHEKIFGQIHEKDVDVLVGTQIVAQGFNFPRVTLVGVVDADTPLFIPDFRSSERAFQLLTQVAGRAGRALITGDVIVQTQQADHPAIRRALESDYLTFANEELAHRKALNYPPFTHLIEVVSVGSNPRKAEDEMGLFVKWVEELSFEDGHAIGILGPTVAKQAWKKGKTRFVALLKVPTPVFERFLDLLRGFLAKKPYNFYVDVDPETLQ